MNLLFYGDPLEPVTKVLLKHKKALGITSLSMRDFLDKATVFDKITEEEASVHWEIPGIGVITNSKETFLINRVLKCPHEWFKDFIKGDRYLAREELMAYLQFALNAFPNKTESPFTSSSFFFM